MQKKGITLVASIILIIFATITVLAVNTFVVQRLLQGESKRAGAGALSLAQAGVQKALYDFRLNAQTGNGYFSLGQTNIDADHYFVLGGVTSDVDWLWVDASTTILGTPFEPPLTPAECRAWGNACDQACDDVEDACDDQCAAEEDICKAACGRDQQCKNACHQVKLACGQACNAAGSDCKGDCRDMEKACTDRNLLMNLKIQSVTDSRDITIERMEVTWDNACKLKEITIDGTKVWQGTSTSPANGVLNPAVVLDTTPGMVPSKYIVDKIKFSCDMTDATRIDINFVMTDGSQKSVRVYPSSTNASFTVKSTGKITSSNVYRTMEAEYNTFTSTILNYQEVNGQVTP